MMFVVVAVAVVTSISTSTSIVTFMVVVEAVGTAGRATETFRMVPTRFPSSTKQIASTMLSSSDETTTVLPISVSSSATTTPAIPLLNCMRGGDMSSDIDGDSDYDEDEEYDEGYDDDIDDDERNGEGDKEEFDHSLIGPPKAGDRKISSSSYRGPDGRHRPPPYPRRPPTSSSSSKRRGQRRSKKHWSAKLASQSLSLTSSLAWNTLVKQPSRLAYHIVRPKHIELVETFGLWRLDQQITLKAKNPRLDDDKIIASVATIEFHPGTNMNNKNRGRGVTFQPTVIVRKIQDDNTTPQGHPKEGQEKSQGTNQKQQHEERQQQQQPIEVVVSRTPYTFKKSSPLSGGIGSFKTQFVARAFLTSSGEMRWYGYKGTWQRKIADRSVIKLVGKIYPVHKQRFGKDHGKYVFSGKSIGTFVARRRIRMVEEEEEDDDYDYDQDESDYEEVDDDIDTDVSLNADDDVEEDGRESISDNEYDDV